MTCYGGATDPKTCKCRRDGLDPKSREQCPYRGLSKRSDDDWASILAAPKPETEAK